MKKSLSSIVVMSAATYMLGQTRLGEIKKADKTDLVMRNHNWKESQTLKDKGYY